MSKVAGSCFVGLLAVLILGIVSMPAVEGQAQHSPHSQPQGKLALAANTTFQKGFHAKLPPHISTLLGISKEEECQVMQSYVHTGNLVQGLDVSVLNRNDVVLFVVDEKTADQSLYLTSPEGTLRRVVSVKSGVGHVLQIKDKDQEAFKQEKRFWVNRMVPPGAGK